MRIVWSTRPGAWERQLLRRCNNPLFPAPLREVTQEQANAARRQDEDEAAAYRSELQNVLSEAAALPANVESEVLLKLKQHLDRLYEQAAGLGGDHTHDQAQIARLIDVLMRTLLRSTLGDAHAQQELAQEQAARAAHYQLVRYPLVAHLLRPDAVVAADALVPTLLSEETAVLDAVLELFDATQRQELARLAYDVLRAREAEGYALPEAWQRAGQIAPAAV